LYFVYDTLYNDKAVGVFVVFVPLQLHGSRVF
jgi:hypothetical protein